MRYLVRNDYHVTQPVIIAALRSDFDMCLTTLLSGVKKDLEEDPIRIFWNTYVECIHWLGSDHYNHISTIMAEGRAWTFVEKELQAVVDLSSLGKAMFGETGQHLAWEKFTAHCATVVASAPTTNAGFKKAEDSPNEIGTPKTLSWTKPNERPKQTANIGDFGAIFLALPKKIAAALRNSGINDEYVLECVWARLWVLR